MDKKLSSRHVGSPTDELRYPKELYYDCDLCGKNGPGSEMINFHWGIGSPGHASMGYIDAPEYWSCSIEHLIEIAHAAIEEHAVEKLLDLHTNHPGSIHHESAKKIKAVRSGEEAGGTDEAAANHN